MMIMKFSKCGNMFVIATIVFFVSGGHVDADGKNEISLRSVEEFHIRMLILPKLANYEIVYEGALGLDSNNTRKAILGGYYFGRWKISQKDGVMEFFVDLNSNTNFASGQIRLSKENLTVVIYGKEGSLLDGSIPGIGSGNDLLKALEKVDVPRRWSVELPKREE